MAQIWSVYMNGDVGKLPSGAVYAATPDAHAPSPTADYSIINGVGEPVDSVSEGGAAPMGQAPLPPESAPDPNNPPSSMPLEQLKQMLSSQLEYYFSRENLANDAYLISQMDNDQYVPIWTVANFNQVKKLTTDIKLITEVLRESPNVQVDEEGQKVRPNHKRCIVILREIPDSTPLEEVKALFSGKGCPKLISCEFAHNNSWYVTFENDEDAQKAYRFLREEVKEFQGKPIMARIKAKPMNRLPMPPVAPGMGGMKNGYRTPPASATSAAVYDPTNAFPPGQQRFVYTNGTSLPHNVQCSLPNQVQIYTFQQHQPFYPPSMLPPHWGATAPAYFDISSVFSVNGLAPQGPFGKSHNNRFMPRNRNKRGSGLEQRTSLSDSGLLRGSHSSHSIAPKTGGSIKVDSTNTPSSVTTKSHYYRGGEVAQTETSDGPLPSTAVRSHDPDDPYRNSQPSAKDSLPPRHRRRRKEDEVQSRSGGSPGPQFDLEADAFPPLPGLEPQVQQGQGGQAPQVAPLSAGTGAGGGAVLAANHQPSSVPVPAPTPKPPPSLDPPTSDPAPPPPPQSAQWAENRLSDVVKGTAKMKSGGTAAKDKEAVSGGNSGVVHPLTPSLPTPPTTPDKTVPGAVNSKSCMPEKLTKTDDALVNGSGELVGSGSGNEVASENVIAEFKQPSPPIATSFVSTIIEPSTPAPVTFNNSSTAQHLPAQSPSDMGVVRLSYAQVAQHHHKEKGDREKQVMAGTNVVQNVTPILPPEEEKKEAPIHHQSKVADSVMSNRGRGGARAAPRRRDNVPRFNSRQRSPK